MSGALGPAYAHWLVARMGLVWRDLTGDDIGLDGAIEIPETDGGILFVQVKTRDKAFRIGSEWGIDYEDRHAGYWLTRGGPVVLVLVERRANDVVCSTWLDFGAIWRSVTAHGSSFKIPHSALDDVNHLHLSCAEATGSRSVELADWLRSVVERHLVEAQLDHASALLEDGRHDDHEVLLEKLRPRSNPPVILQVLKAKRRTAHCGDNAGADRFEELVASARDAIARAPAKGRPRLEAMLRYEVGQQRFWLALQSGSASTRWEEALTALKESLDACGELENRLIAMTEIVHVEAMRQRYVGVPLAARSVDDLELLLREWRTGPVLVHETRGHSQRALNALLSLARSALVCGDRDRALRHLAEIRDAYSQPSAYHTALWTAHLMIVEGWYQLSLDKTGAQTWLSAARHAAAAAGAHHNPQLSAYLKLLETVAQPIA